MTSFGDAGFGSTGDQLRKWSLIRTRPRMPGKLPEIEQLQTTEAAKSKHGRSKLLPGGVMKLETSSYGCCLRLPVDLDPNSASPELSTSNEAVFAGAGAKLFFAAGETPCFPIIDSRIAQKEHSRQYGDALESHKLGLEMEDHDDVQLYKDLLQKRMSACLASILITIVFLLSLSTYFGATLCLNFNLTYNLTLYILAFPQ
ncbi:hypothetical protein QYF36_024437 [Acer negundo]|nr:hypothetical protein QYF36_024437 [Acer negundo]